MSEVPSNLIPTRITQLPTAPVADENSLMMIVYQGNNYQIRVGDLLSVAGVPTSRQVIAGTGMTGGGQLTGNVTLSVANGGIGTTQLASSGVTPGTYGDATNIPVFIVDATGRVMAATTVPASGGGGVPTTTEVIAGDGLSGGGQLTGNVTLTANLSDAIPLSIDTTGFAGVSLDISRADHQHPAIDLAADSQVDGLLGLNNGGTARSLVPEAGAMVWSGADGLYIGPAGSAGQVLISGGAGEPTWGSALVITDQAANLVYAGPTSGAAAPTSFRNLVNGDLPDSGAAANTYGSSSAVPVITLNSKGVITSITTAGISGVTSVNGDTGVVVLDYADVGAPSTSGTGATGTWGISISGNAATATSATNVAGGAANKIVYNTASNTSAFIDAPTVSATFLKWTGSAFAWDTAGAGTVTSVGGTGTVSGISLSGTVTSSGNLTLGGALDLSAPPVIGGTTPNTATFTTANATTVDTTNIEVTTLKAKDGTSAGSIADSTGVVTLASSVLTTTDINGGTIDGTTIGASVAAAVTGTTITASTQFSGAGTGLTGTGSSFTAGSATNLAGGAASQIPYQTGAGATAFLANGTAGEVLTSNGASAPTWGGLNGGTF